MARMTRTALAAKVLVALKAAEPPAGTSGTMAVAMVASLANRRTGTSATSVPDRLYTTPERSTGWPAAGCAGSNARSAVSTSRSSGAFVSVTQFMSMPSPPSMSSATATTSTIPAR